MNIKTFISENLMAFSDAVYNAPRIEVTQVQVETGFAGTGSDVPGFGEGGII